MRVVPSQDTLGCHSTDGARRGGFRKLAVRVKQPGYAARARAGYYAPKGQALRVSL